MQKTKFKKVIALVMVAIISCTALVGCKASDKNDTPSQIVDEAHLELFPEDCELTDDEMKSVAAEYADYMTKALASEGYLVSSRIDDDGSVHFDGEKAGTNGNEAETVKDLKTFASVKDCFAYLYNCGQVSIEGKLLVSVSDTVVDAVDSVGEEPDVSDSAENSEITDSDETEENETETVDSETSSKGE